MSWDPVAATESTLGGERKFVKRDLRAFLPQTFADNGRQADGCFVCSEACTQAVNNRHVILMNL